MEHNHEGIASGSHDYPYHRGRYEQLHEPPTEQHDPNGLFGVVPRRLDQQQPRVGDLHDFGVGVDDGGTMRLGGSGGLGLVGGGMDVDPYYATATAVEDRQGDQQHQQQGGQFLDLVGRGGGPLNGGIGASAGAGASAGSGLPPEEMIRLRRLALEDMITAQQRQVQIQLQRRAQRQMQMQNLQLQQQHSAPASPYGSNPAALWGAQRVGSGGGIGCDGGGGRPTSAGGQQQQRQRSLSEAVVAWGGDGGGPALASSPSSAPSSPSNLLKQPRGPFLPAAIPSSAAAAAAEMDLFHHTTRSSAMTQHHGGRASTSILGGGRMGFGPPRRAGHQEYTTAKSSDAVGGAPPPPPPASHPDVAAGAGAGGLEEFGGEDAVRSYPSSSSSSLSLSSMAASTSGGESKSAGKAAAAPIHEPSATPPSAPALSPDEAAVLATTEKQPRSSSPTPPPQRRRRGRPPKKKEEEENGTTTAKMATSARTGRTRRNGRRDAEPSATAAAAAAATATTVSSRLDDVGSKDEVDVGSKPKSSEGASVDMTAAAAPPEGRKRPPVHVLFTATTVASSNGSGTDEAHAAKKNDATDCICDAQKLPSNDPAPQSGTKSHHQQPRRQRPLVLRHDLFASSPSSPLPVVVVGASAKEEDEPMSVPPEMEGMAKARAETEASGGHAGLTTLDVDGDGVVALTGAGGRSGGALVDGGGRVKKRRRTKKKGKKRPPRNDDDDDDDGGGDIGGGEGGAAMNSRSFLAYLGGGGAGDDGVVGGPDNGLARGGGGGGDDDREAAMIAKSSSTTTTERRGNGNRKKRRKGGGGQIIVQVDSFLGGGDGRGGNAIAGTAATSSSAAWDGGGRVNGGDVPSLPSHLRGGGGEEAPSVREQGYFEGVAPLSLPEDGTYLTETHRLVRANLEVFSATALDVMDAKPGRRGPIVVGTIGIRCVHCAERVREQRRNGLAGGVGGDADHHRVAWTKKGTVDRRAKGGLAGSVSYPVTIDGLYSLCAQKNNLHFAKCPNLPADVRAEFAALSGDGKSTRGYSRGGTSAKVYYVQAAKRIGLVDVPSGIRFGRDPSLPPLPFDVDGLEPQRPQQRAELRAKALAQPTDAAADIGGDRTSAGTGDDDEDEAYATLPPIGDTVTQRGSDEETERILRSSALGNGGGLSLVRPETRHYVTDFVYLLMLQMGIYRATTFDLSSRSGRAQKMDVGYAGLCCRHCVNEESLQTSAGAPVAPQPGGSGKFFYSAPDNLASATGTAFYAHITKCSMVPEEVRRLLPRLKNIHTKQRTLLPHGSQRRFFHYIWKKLRDADKGPSRASSTSLAKEPTISSEDSHVDDLEIPEESASRVDEVSATDAINAPKLDLQQINHKVPKDPADQGMKVLSKEIVAENGSHFMNGRNESGADVDGVNMPTGMKANPHKGAYVVVNGNNLASCSGGKNMNKTQQTHIDDAVLRRYAFVRGRSGWLTCKRCRMVPLDLRADGSILAPPVSPKATNPQEDWTIEASIRSHHSICRGDDFDLSLAVSTVEKMTSSIPGMTFETLIQPAFKAVVRALVGGNDDLETVFTDGVYCAYLLMQPQVETVSTVDIDGHMLWKSFPSDIDKDAVGKALKAWVCCLVEDVKAKGICLEGLLTTKSFVDFVNIICQGAVYELPSIDDFPGDD